MRCTQAIGYLLVCETLMERYKYRFSHKHVVIVVHFKSLECIYAISYAEWDIRKWINKYRINNDMTLHLFHFLNCYILRAK